MVILYLLLAAAIALLWLRISNIDKIMDANLSVLRDEIRFLRQRLEEQRHSGEEAPQTTAHQKEGIDGSTEQSAVSPEEKTIEPKQPEETPAATIPISPPPLVAEEVPEMPPPIPEYLHTEPAQEEETIQPTDPLEDTLPGIAVSRQPEWVTKWKQFKDNVDWEQFTGTRLFAWLGVLALFIAGIFFIKLSIERNWIPASLRLAIGALLGIGLLLSAWKFDKNRLLVMRHTVTAAGIGLLYTVVFTATLYYAYLPNLAGFALLTLISATAFVLAVFHRGISISVLGAIGAYATPVMLGSESGSLWLLFIYLTLVNFGLYKVTEKLESITLMTLASIGTLFVLSLAILLPADQPSSLEIALVLGGNLIIFTWFLIKQIGSARKYRTILLSGIVLFTSALLFASLLILMDQGWKPVLLISIAVACAYTLGYFRKDWVKKVVPYSSLSFFPVLMWMFTGFDSRSFSFGFILVFLYGTIGSVGPVLLVKKYGRKRALIGWLKIYPVAISVLCLIGVIINPQGSLYFWPVMLAVQIVGIGVSLLFRAFVQVFIILAIFVSGALFWMNHIPDGGLGLGFFAFLLITGILLSLLILVAASQVPRWLKTLEVTQGEAHKETQLEKWLLAAPSAGVFVLIGASFLIPYPYFPHPGMLTLFCFLLVALFLTRRIQFEPPGVVSLLSALVAQSIWVLKPDLTTEALFAAIVWSLTLFILSIVSPFFAFKHHTLWKKTWCSTALFEAGQAVFLFYSVKRMWDHPLCDWLPLLLFLLKLPAVVVLLKQLREKQERSAILAFHGGALLFYLSTLPVFVLSEGWLGLALVFEALALLWLNRRVEHSGLRYTAVIMAPIGFLGILQKSAGLKTVDSLPVLNMSTMALAAAVIALALSVSQAGFPRAQLKRLHLPDTFRWFTVIAGFILMHVVIAEFFAEPSQFYQWYPKGDFLHWSVYLIGWTFMGVFLWQFKNLPRVMKAAGMALIAIGACGLLSLPMWLPNAVAAMQPLVNSALFAYLVMLGILSFSYFKEPWSRATIKNTFLAFALLTFYMLLKVEKNTLFQPGLSFTLFLNHTLLKSVASSCGAVIYGTVLLIWRRRLDKPFRMAGLVLLILGMVQSLLVPFRFPVESGAMAPLLNWPTLAYLFIIGITICLIFVKLPNWPVPKIKQGPFLCTVLAVFIFVVLNIQIALCFGLPDRSFSLMPRGHWPHLFAYSLGWLIYGIGLISFGIVFSNPLARRAAMVLVITTAVKVFIFDLASLKQLYRVGSFIGLAFVLILVSYLYQKFMPGDSSPDKGSYDENEMDRN